MTPMTLMTSFSHIFLPFFSWGLSRRKVISVIGVIAELIGKDL
jgi:hypothetical protein